MCKASTRRWLVTSPTYSSETLLSSSPNSSTKTTPQAPTTSKSVSPCSPFSLTSSLPPHPNHFKLTQSHIQNIQSTNWQTVRFKPPPAGSSIGWRVEFRPMEVQMTDFENAAFAVFIVLLSRAILHYSLNFYIPISKVRSHSPIPELNI